MQAVDRPRPDALSQTQTILGKVFYILIRNDPDKSELLKNRQFLYGEVYLSGRCCLYAQQSNIPLVMSGIVGADQTSQETNLVPTCAVMRK